MAGRVTRGYLELPWGQVHYRAVDAADSAGAEARPLLLMLHQTPLDSEHYERVLPPIGRKPFGEGRRPGIQFFRRDASR